MTHDWVSYLQIGVLTMIWPIAQTRFIHANLGAGPVENIAPMDQTRGSAIVFKNPACPDNGHAVYQIRPPCP